MKTVRMERTEALELGHTFPFAYIRSLSQVTLGPTPAEDPEDLLEARFFSSTEEIRVFLGEDGLQAVRLTEEGPRGVCLEETRKLMNPLFGSEITICREIAFDEDGQAYISTVRLSGWKGGKG